MGRRFNNFVPRSRAKRRAKFEGTISEEPEEIQRQHAERVQLLRAKAAAKRKCKEKS
jgi:hypothetical protein